jgi:hypothetical protein
VVVVVVVMVLTIAPTLSHSIEAAAKRIVDADGIAILQDVTKREFFEGQGR